MNPTVSVPSYCSFFHLPPFQFWYSSLALCISVSHAENKLKAAKYIKGTFRMESGSFSETLVPIYQTARRHITEYRNRNELHNCKTPT